MDELFILFHLFPHIQTAPRHHFAGAQAHVQDQIPELGFPSQSASTTDWFNNVKLSSWDWTFYNPFSKVWVGLVPHSFVKRLCCPTWGCLPSLIGEVHLTVVFVTFAGTTNKDHNVFSRVSPPDSLFRLSVPFHCSEYIWPRPYQFLWGRNCLWFELEIFFPVWQVYFQCTCFSIN